MEGIIEKIISILTLMFILTLHLPIAECSLSLTGSGLILGLDDHHSSFGLTQLDAVLL